MNAIYWLDKTICTFSANFAFDTATYERTNIYKTRDVVKTYLDVTYEDLFWIAPILAKVEFGQIHSLMYQKLKIAPTPYCQCSQVDQTVSHILQDCPLLGQLRRTTWPEGATVRQKLWGDAWGSCRRRSSLSRPRDCKCDGDRKEEKKQILTPAESANNEL